MNDVLETTKRALARAGTLEVVDERGTLRVSRVRKVPSRGLFRLLIPRALARVSSPSAVRVRPDALAWFTLVILAGGVFMELTADRVHYPRDYPPAFVFTLATLYPFFLALEMRATRREIDRVLASRL
jgi:hypothetical protein